MCNHTVGILLKLSGPATWAMPNKLLISRTWVPPVPPRILAFGTPPRSAPPIPDPPPPVLSPRARVWNVARLLLEPHLAVQPMTPWEIHMSRWENLLKSVMVNGYKGKTRIINQPINRWYKPFPNGWFITPQISIMWNHVILKRYPVPSGNFT